LVNSPGRDSRWTEYRIVTPAKGVDAIVECTLAEDFEFADPHRLTASIEEKAVQIIEDVERFFSDHDTRSRT